MKPITRPIYLNSKPRRKSRLIRPSPAKSPEKLSQIAEMERSIERLSARLDQVEFAQMQRDAIPAK